jgi:F420-0:gamma-glutamyl ligase
MIVKAIKTEKILPNAKTITEILDDYLENLSEGSILAITSKIISLCEGRVVPIAGTDKEQLIMQEADYYMPAKASKYSYHFTIKNRTLTSASGIDESNGDGNYILWPTNAQETANVIRQYLKNRFGLKKVGMIITDSTCVPMRLGTIGTFIGFSGFKAVNYYTGTPDLFGRPFQWGRLGVAMNLAASAVLTMGEGPEQTPMAVIEDAMFVVFNEDNPSKEELDEVIIKQEDDIYYPMINKVQWQKGGKNKSR